LAPFLEAFVRREHGGRVLVAPTDELEEEHRAVAGHGQIADLVDHEERGIREGREPTCKTTGGLRFLERGDELGERAVVDAPAALRSSDGEADRQMRLTDTRRAEQYDVLLALDEAELVQALDLLALDRGLEGEVEVGQSLHGRKSRRAHRRLQPAV